MSSRHYSEDELSLFVSGHEEAAEEGQFRMHLSSCDECSLRLRDQAHLELHIRAIAQQVKSCHCCRRIVRDSRCLHCGAASVVAGYEIQEVLVSNSHGRIYLAKDVHGYLVALKELAFVQSPSVQDIEAFEREASILRTLDHPAIPKFLATFREGEGVSTRFYIAQEYIEGPSLLLRLQNHQFTEQEAIDIAKQVLEILCYLQSLSPKVFHRDIKPSNIICADGDRIVLVDFGAARSLGSTASATLVGTFGYMPVEQLGGIVDATSDVYALGATLCELLTRREPWHLLEDRSVLTRMNVSEKLRTILTKMVALQQGNRYSSAQEALNALNTPQPIFNTGQSHARQGFSPRLVALAALVCTMAVGGVYFLTAKMGREDSVPSTSQFSAEVKISTQPSGAEIYLNGGKIGSSPMTFGGLLPGQHSIVVKASGYKDATRIVQAGPERPQSITIILEPIVFDPDRCKGSSDPLCGF